MGSLDDSRGLACRDRAMGLDSVLLTLCVLAGHPQIAYIGILTSGVLAGVLLPWSRLICLRASS